MERFDRDPILIGTTIHLLYGVWPNMKVEDYLGILDGIRDGGINVVGLESFDPEASKLERDFLQART